MEKTFYLIALMYDHSVWIELRCALEDFLWQSSDLLGKLDEMREDLNANDFADDVTSAKQVGYKFHQLFVYLID